MDELYDEMPLAVLKGIVRDMHTSDSGKYAKRLEATLFDGIGCVRLVWFQNIAWVKESLKPNVVYLVIGKPTWYNDGWQIVHPEIEAVSQDGERHNHHFFPVYSCTEKAKAKGIQSKTIARFVETLLNQVGGAIAETLPDYVVRRYQLMAYRDAVRAMHFPPDSLTLQAASQRLKFDEMFFMQLDYQYRRTERQRCSQGLIFSRVGDHFNCFYSEKLPFALTGAQKRVVKEIWGDMKSGRQMNRLLQGDVGSGKTLVALLTILLAVDNGCQTCLMAPTEILAHQHYENFCRLLDGLDIKIALLTGSVKQGQKRKLKEQVKKGEVEIVIGTHALLEKNVEFQNLGYVVIDEQHRFGVEQRSKLWTKNTIAPHILVMTATPIPRTLAMTLYGDLDCSVIDELPPGRQPIMTVHATDSKRLLLFSFIRKQIGEGRQVYVVYPLINESEKSDLKDLMDGYDSISRAFPQPQYQISIVHGQMTAEAKEYEMDRFKKGETNIMVSTTVIEVGVDVPNATVMVIENAERFGLSQLHQLRGRVGRGGGQSYCVLMTKDKLSSNSTQRIETMCSTSDGFRIAEADLKLRGPGDLQGLKQSGLLDLKLCDIVDDEPIVKATRDEVMAILTTDPILQRPENIVLRQYMAKRKNEPHWERIS